MSTTRKGGRPKKPAGEKAEQFSLRLAPKLRFGLETLARLQGRSMSQVIEWGLKTSLQSVKLKLSRTLADVVEIAWREPTEWQRLRYLWKMDPALVPFDVRHACNLVEISKEEALWKIETGSEEERERLRSLGGLRIKWLKLIETIWPKLLADAEELRFEPKMTRRNGMPLLSACGLYYFLFRDFNDRQLSLEDLIDKTYWKAKERFGDDFSFEPEAPPLPPYGSVPDADSMPVEPIATQAADQAESAARFSAK